MQFEKKKQQENINMKIIWKLYFRDKNLNSFLIPSNLLRQSKMSLKK